MAALDKSAHFHCKACQRELKYLGRLERTVWQNLRDVRGCVECSVILIEHDNGRLEWR